MTVADKIKEIVNSADLEEDTIEKLVAMAYWIGREEKAKEMDESIKALLRKQHEKANACRYHIMASEIVGPDNYIYDPDYAGDMTEMFGVDETKL